MAIESRKAPAEGRTTLIRRIVAFSVLAALAVAVAGTYLFDSFRICRDSATDAGSVTLCGPVGPADLPAIGVVLLVALLLLLPDLEELAIPGLVSLKARVQHQEQKLAAVENSVNQIALSQTNVTIGLPAVVPDFGRLPEETDRKAELFRAAPDVRSSVGMQPVAEARMVAPDRAVREAQVLDLWEKLSRFIPWTPAGRRLDADAFSQAKYHELLEWAETFRPELRDLQVIRNTVAHEPTNLTNAQLDQAIELGEKLLGLLQEVLQSTRE